MRYFGIGRKKSIHLVRRNENVTRTVTTCLVTGNYTTLHRESAMSPLFYNTGRLFFLCSVYEEIGDI